MTIDTSYYPYPYCPASYPFTVTATSGTNVGTSGTTMLLVTSVGPPILASITTDKTAYRVGDTVIISITINRPGEGTLTVTAPTGSNVYNLPPTYAGVYTQKVTASVIGTWTVNFLADDFCGGQSSASTSFIVSPDTYDVSVTLSGIPANVPVNYQVDGQPGGSISGSKTLSFKVGTSHTVTLDQYVPGDTGVRYYAAQNSWTVTSADSHTVQYQTQYELTVSTDPSGVAQLSGAGWYNAGETAQTGQAPNIQPGGAGTQYVFNTWLVDGVAANGNPIPVVMNGPHNAVAKYTQQFELTVDSPNGLGNPQGSGYYDAGSTATFSVTSPTGFLIQQVLDHWEGDYSGTSPQGSITMDGARTVHAVWRTDYTQLYIAGGAAVVLIAILAAVMARRRRGGKTPVEKKAPPPEHEEKKSLHIGKSEES